MPNDLTPSAPLGRPITPVLSQPLNALLSIETSDERAVMEIASTPALCREAEAALPALKVVATMRAGATGVRSVVGRRFALYPQPDRSDGEWDAWWADYVDALQHCTMPGLEAAMAAYVKDPASEFIPKPGKLLELARTVENPAATAFSRARRAVEQQEALEASRAAAAQAHAPTDESRAAVRKMLTEYQAKVSVPERLKARQDTPATHGKTDEKGITPELRALMARQQEQQR